MPKPFEVEHALAIAVSALVIGGFLSALSLVQITVEDIGLGGWAYWLLAGGLIVFVVGLYLFIGYMRRANEFEEYMKIESKAEFKKKQDDAEYLAWRMPSKFGERLQEKEDDLGIK
ncbi:MAG: DUF3198 domain-containing protein [Methanomassiliicoccales archaeon]|jgi:hypothetical protein|nr:DUF3198 domain-containing protein [Methanomassiliicoccales archaeon]